MQDPWNKLVWRGPIQICVGMGMKSWPTAKKELKRLGCLRYISGRPVVYVEQYKEALKKDYGGIDDKKKDANQGAGLSTQERSIRSRSSLNR